jgi:hypothetical protein
MNDAWILEEVFADARDDSELYARKSGEAGGGEYERGASWAFGLISQRIAGAKDERRAAERLYPERNKHV